MSDVAFRTDVGNIDSTTHRQNNMVVLKPRVRRAIYANPVLPKEDSYNKNRGFVLDLLFDHLVNAWREDTMYQSSTSIMKAHPSYEALIRMGDAALNRVLRRMSDGAVYIHWFPVLKTLAGEDPVPPESRGKIAEMAQSWLEWGRANRRI